jgi:hypothetical protein
MLNPANMPRLVTKIRNATEWIFYIQFPVEGTYRLVYLFLLTLTHSCEKEGVDLLCHKQDLDHNLTAQG